MYFTIKDLGYIRKDCVVSGYIQAMAEGNQVDKVVKGLANIDKLTKDSKLTFVDCFYYSETDKKMFFVLEDENGIYITREDNVEAIQSPKDVLDSYGFTNLIKAGNKTILLSGKQKWTTTKMPEDKEDIEKAVMIVLLKAEGYNIQDVYKMIELVR